MDVLPDCSYRWRERDGQRRQSCHLNAASGLIAERLAEELAAGIEGARGVRGFAFPLQGRLNPKGGKTEPAMGRVILSFMLDSKVLQKSGGLASHLRKLITK